MLRVASASLIEGRLRRRSRWRSQAWRPAAAARNRSPGRSGTPSARHYDLAARSSLHGSGGNAGDGSTGPRPKIATVERREARVPPMRGARRLASAWRAALWHAAGAAAPERRLGAPPPLGGG